MQRCHRVRSHVRGHEHREHCRDVADANSSLEPGDGLGDPAAVDLRVLQVQKVSQLVRYCRFEGLLVVELCILPVEQGKAFNDR